MEVNLDRIPVSADSQQAVALEVFYEVILDFIFIQVISIDQTLRIIFKFKHFEVSSLLLLTNYEYSLPKRRHQIKESIYSMWD